MMAGYPDEKYAIHDRSSAPSTNDDDQYLSQVPVISLGQ